MLIFQVNSRISILRNLVAKNSNNIEQDVLKICEARSESQSEWLNYMKEAENHFNQVCDNLNSNESCLNEIAGRWYIVSHIVFRFVC